MRKPDASEILVGTVVAILVLLVGILINRAMGILSLQALTIAVGICLVIVLGVVAIVWVFGRASHQAEIEEIIGNLRSLIPTAPFNWLYSEAQMNEVEARVQGKDIWVISPDLSYDTRTPDADSIGVVKKNLTRKITYTYIVPDMPEIDAVLPNLRRVFASHLGQLIIMKLSSEEFHLLAAAHIVIYNPNIEDGEKLEVFLELPLEQRGHGRGYWVKVADDAALGFVGRFRRLVERSKIA